MRQRYSKPNLVYKTLKKSNSIVDRISGNKRNILIVAICVLAFLFVAMRFKPLFFTALLIVLGAFSMIHIRYFRYAHYLGFELCMMATVLTSLAYGRYIGAIVGAVSIFSALIISGYFKYSSFVSVLTLPFIGIITPFFSNLPLPYTGLLMTVIYDIIIVPLYILLGSRVSSSIAFFISHILINFWIFSTIAPIIYRFMI